MKTLSPLLVAVSLALLLIFGAKVAHAQEDLTPPTLLDVQFSPETIDTSSGPVTVTVSVHVTDDLSGVQWVVLGFRKPGTTQSIKIDIVPSASWGKLIGGDNLNGTYQSDMVLPRYSAYGEWELYYTVLVDNVGNRIDQHKPEDDSEGLDKGNQWPSLFNGFAFKVGTAQQQPARLFLPSIGL